MGINVKGERIMSIKLPIKHEIEIECVYCSKAICDEITIEEIEFASSEERSMGIETQYDFEKEIKCPYCERCFEVSGEVWEYPEDVVNLIQLV